MARIKYSEYYPVQEITAEFAPRHYFCKKATEKCVIDGNLDKPFWQDAPWSEYFEDIEAPHPRPKPRYQTRMKMKWDEEYLYVGAMLEEDRIWAHLTERDSVIYLDNDFEVFIDPDGDTHNYFEFEMNALNTVWDLFLPKPYRDGAPPLNAFDYQGLKSAVKIDGKLNDPTVKSNYWSVEIAFPMQVLLQCADREPQIGDYWRIDFSRVEWHSEIVDGQYQRKINPETGKPYPEDNWIWSPTGIIDMHCPERWGFLIFVDEIPDEPFVIPRDEYIKWELRKIYYRERKMYTETGKYTDDFSLLRGDDEWTIEPKIYVTPSLFEANAPTADGKKMWCIRTDGKIYKLPED